MVHQTWGVERAWNGEESLAACVAAIVALAVALVRRGKRSLPLGLLELAASAGVAVLNSLYVDANSGDIFVRGTLIPSGMGTAPYLGLGAGVVMTVGSVFGLSGGAPASGPSQAPVG